MASDIISFIKISLKGKTLIKMDGSVQIIGGQHGVKGCPFRIGNDMNGAFMPRNPRGPDSLDGSTPIAKE
jgi:hypothetical protein